ncbi:DUF6887 family protein [Roseofilum acuticapitatum]|uniref:DUF6887 family protein n=1 Tax=Roseofilum acuticapitatum TaxID=3082945 RepID=UPI003D2F637D
MSIKELRAYVLEHRDDMEALDALVSMKPVFGNKSKRETKAELLRYQVKDITYSRKTGDKSKAIPSDSMAVSK